MRTPPELLPAGGPQGLVHILAKSPSNSLKAFYLSPARAGRITGNSHTVTATYIDQNGNGISGRTVSFSLEHPSVNSATDTGTTASNGTVSWDPPFTGVNAGKDFILATLVDGGVTYEARAEVDWSDQLVTITATDSEADEEGLLEGQFKITRTGDLQSSLTIELEFPVPPGSAIRGSDYLEDPAFSSVIAFSPTQSEIFIDIIPVQDSRVEPTETVVLTILPGTGYAVDAVDSATVNILDNDDGTPIPISYTIVPLGKPTYATSWESSAYHLNNNSVPSIAGDFRPDQNYYYQHTFRGYNGAITDLTASYPTVSSYGYGINNSNIVVGRTDYGNQYTFKPAKWSSSGTLTILKRLASGSDDSAVAINTSGTIVGSSRNSSGKMRAVRWEPGSETTVVDDLRSIDQNNASTVYAYGINASGFIVGKSQIQGVGSAYHGFWISPGDWIQGDANDIGAIKNDAAANSEATAINDLNEIVGASDTAAGEYRAFYKAPSSEKNSGFTDLLTLANGNRSIALGINNVGHIVGSSRTTTTGANRAFIFYNTGTAMVDLNSLLSNGSGWTLVSAEEINDGGFIVGWGYYGGYKTAFILSPNFQ